MDNPAVARSVAESGRGLAVLSPQQLPLSGDGTTRRLPQARNDHAHAHVQRDAQGRDPASEKYRSTTLFGNTRVITQVKS